jgi:hypothetical protein
MSFMPKEKILIALFVILFGVAARIFLVEFVQIPNFEIVTALALVAGVFLGGSFILIVPLGIIAISDIYLGNTSILIFTWSAFIAIGVFGWLLRKRKAFNCHFVAQMTAMGIISSLFFYIYTNFGWWLLTNMYPPTFEGLIYCYIAALPFLKTNLLGNLFFVPVFISLALIVQKYCPVFCFKIQTMVKKLIGARTSL